MADFEALTIKFVVLYHTLVDVTRLVADSAEAIKFSVLEKAFLDLVAVKDNSRNTMRNVGAATKLPVDRPVIIFDLFELDLWAVEIEIRAIGVVQDLLDRERLQLFPTSE